MAIKAKRKVKAKPREKRWMVSGDTASHREHVNAELKAIAGLLELHGRRMDGFILSLKCAFEIQAELTSTREKLAVQASHVRRLLGDKALLVTERDALRHQVRALEAVNRVG